MEIITAGDGTAHVSSADDGAIYASMVGGDCYVTGVGEKLSCTMQGANTALVGTGVGFMYGRAFRVVTPEEVTIQSGTQSQRRNDIICAHFTTSSTGDESGELVVLKGTPTSGLEAEDPEIPSGNILEGATEAYMPLWRIPLDGINVGEPEAMFNVLMSMSELQGEIDEVWDSVYQLTSTSSPTSVTEDYAVGVEGKAELPHGFKAAGIVGIRSNHNLSVVFGRFDVEDDGSWLVVVLPYSSYSDLTVTVRILCIPAG